MQTGRLCESVLALKLGLSRSSLTPEYHGVRAHWFSTKTCPVFQYFCLSKAGFKVSPPPEFDPVLLHIPRIRKLPFRFCMDVLRQNWLTTVDIVSKETALFTIFSVPAVTPYTCDRNFYCSGDTIVLGRRASPHGVMKIPYNAPSRIELSRKANGLNGTVLRVAEDDVGFNYKSQQKWLMVCNDRFSEAARNVSCTQLGLTLHQYAS